ncbi:MAG: hydrogenase expression/formation protein HypE [Actinobacteria bacterium]|nr:hydrogenase expression/formation protein HypE [Actinomycetota bacterium]
MHDLIRELFIEKFANPVLAKEDDSAVLEVVGGRLAFTTDTYVVKPLFFPGGDIGRLAVCGTVNDLATSGATPKYLSCGFVIEEGLSLEVLERVLDSMVEAAAEAWVTIVTGDTKVVEKGGADGLFINTAGIGAVPEGVVLSGANLKVGDKIILSGTLGDHGIAVISKREGFEFSSPAMSDAAPLNGLVADLLSAAKSVRALRDPTRGGLASTLNEFATASKVGIEIDEAAVPIKPEVMAACEMLGYDPFHVANEGKLIAVVGAEEAPVALETMRRHLYGQDAAIIGKVTAGPPGRVILKTPIGSTRILDMLVGEQLPRIC